jgi:hypothetical protein
MGPGLRKKRETGKTGLRETHMSGFRTFQFLFAFSFIEPKLDTPYNDL